MEFFPDFQTRTALRSHQANKKILSYYTLKDSMKLNWKFQLGWGGGGTLGARGFSCAVSGFESPKCPARKTSGPEHDPFDSAEPITVQPHLPIPKHPESGCFADWFLGDVECFKCSDWITITIGT